MASVQEIEQAVSQLPTRELAEFRAWFMRFDADQWDREIAQDAKNGKLDTLAEQALADLASGRTRPL